MSLDERELKELYKKKADEHTEAILRFSGDNRKTLPIFDAIDRAGVEHDQWAKGTIDFANQKLSEAVTDILFTSTGIEDRSPSPPTIEATPPPELPQVSQQLPLSETSELPPVEADLGPASPVLPEVGFNTPPLNQERQDTREVPSNPQSSKGPPPQDLPQAEQKPERPSRFDDPGILARKDPQPPKRELDNGALGLMNKPVFGHYAPFAFSGFSLNDINTQMPQIEVETQGQVAGDMEFVSELTEQTSEYMAFTLQKIARALEYLKTELDEVNEIIDRSFE